MTKTYLAFSAFFLALIFASFLSSVSAQSLRGENPRSYPGKQANEELNQPSNAVSTGFGAESTTSLWTFDFSGSTGLTFGNDANGGARWKVVTALEPNLTTQNFGPTFNSTSGGSFALINSDSFPADTQDDYLILKVGTSLVGQSGVQLSFRHYFRRFAEDHVVEVSSDSLTWVPFYSSSTVIPRNTTINNSTLTRINISSVAANQPQIWVRFRYVGAWDWFWALDDVEIANLPPNDMILEDWDIVPKVGLCFNAQMARSQMQDSLIFSGAVHNFGLNTQSNVRLNARAFQGATPLYNTNSPAIAGLSSNARDTLDASPYWAMSGRPVGTYTLKIEVLSDSADGSPSNNLDTTMLLVTEDRISPFYPASTSLGTLGTASFSGEEDGVILTSLVNLSAQDTVTGIRVYLRSTTVPGGLVAVSMRDTDGIAGSPAIEFPVLVESDLTTITAADVARGYMDIPIPTVLAGVPQERILPAGPYYAAAQLFSNSGANHIRIPDDLSNDAFMPWYASMIYLPTDGSWYSNGIAVGVAALFSSTTSVGELATTGAAPQAYPNPFQDELSWNLRLDQPTVLNLLCYDMQGRCVAEGPSISSEGGDFVYRSSLGHLPNGLYRVELRSGQNRLGSRLLVKTAR
ncbi:MAG: T9SS C-terminal target domain-containing protein [Cytophagia bacterium]|nr:T9SS C-terminal target domain-containing protein [Cytophagia bacterium]